MFNDERKNTRNQSIKANLYSYIALSEPSKTDRFLASKGYPIAQNDWQRINNLTEYVHQNKNDLYAVVNELHPDKELITETISKFDDKYKNACGCSALLLGADGEKSNKFGLKYADANTQTMTERPIDTQSKRYDLIETVGIVAVTFMVIAGTVAILRKN